MLHLNKKVKFFYALTTKYISLKRTFSCKNFELTCFLLFFFVLIRFRKKKNRKNLRGACYKLYNCGVHERAQSNW